jgi:hypothetical protein
MIATDGDVGNRAANALLGDLSFYWLGWQPGAFSLFYNK